MKNRMTWFLRASAHHLTMQIGFKWAETFPMYFVVGFPRSGTSWLSELVADYFNIPRPRHYYLPIAFSSVIHTHYRANRKFKNTFYIYRDGRDSYVSGFCRLIKLKEMDPNDVLVKKYSKIIPHLDDTNLTKENFYLYLKHQLEKESINWSQHIENWLTHQNSQNVSFLSYEDLIQAPEKTLTHALERFTKNVNQSIVDQVCQKHSFKSQQSRPSTQHRTFLRKGVQGDWQNYFNMKSATLFNEHCGKLLIKLGYEKDGSWVNNTIE